MTYNTGNPIGSTDARDRSDNSENLDLAVNSLSQTFVDRLGVTRDTLEGVYQKSAYYRAGTFDAGYTLTNNRQTLAYGNIEYSWSGAFPKIVPVMSTPETTGGVGPGAWVDRTQETLMTELSSETGGQLVSVGASTVYEMLNEARPLSFYGSDSTALHDLLVYAKDTSKPIKLDRDVTVSSLIDVDFTESKLVWFFNGYSINADLTCIKLSNLAYGSEIHDPQFKNITNPWCITRWDSSGHWLSDGANVLATLIQTSADGYYQPTSNDTDIWGSLTTTQQSQNIMSRLQIHSSDGVKIYRPKGRMCGYLFTMCNHTRVFCPDIQSGGKGATGTIVFSNLDDAGHGFDNHVYGGSIRYGSYSSISFLRNKQGGAHGVNPFRSGESGVKTYQNEVSGRSARCYEMQITDITSLQTVFDGVDATADIGTETTRIDDYPISVYAWNRLPSNHILRNITSIGCRKTGLVTDGAGTLYDKVTAIDTLTAGIISYGENGNFIEPTAINCNRGNNASYHQLQFANANMILRPTVRTESFINAGQSLYAPNGVVANPVINSTLPSTIRGVMSQQVGRVDVSDGNTTETQAVINLWPRKSLMANAISTIKGVITNAVSGSETGYVDIPSRSTGTEVHGLRALPDNGGVGVLGMGVSVVVPSQLANSEISFRQNGTSIQVVAKLADGTVKTGTIVA